MNCIKALFLTLLCIMAATQAYAQKGGIGESLGNPQFLPNAIYEVKYWTDMSGRSSDVKIDTMIFFGNDRVAFQYASSRSVSYKYRQTDSLVYSIAPKFGLGEKEWILGENYLRRMNRATVPFKGFDRSIYRIYISTLNTKDSGQGEYVLVSNQFGVLYRYNNRGDVWMLNRIDVVRDGKIMDEIDLLPLQMDLMRTEIFRTAEN